MSSVPAHSFVAKHPETDYTKWYLFPPYAYGFSANVTSEDKATAKITYPFIITKIKPNGPADRLGLQVGDQILAIRLAPAKIGDPQLPVHDVCCVNDNSHKDKDGFSTPVKVVDDQTKLRMDLAAECSVYVHLRQRCQTPDCRGEMQISSDAMDHSLLCTQCGVVAATRMSGYFFEELTPVQAENYRLQRLARGPRAEESLSMRTETVPVFQGIGRAAPPQQILQDAYKHHDASTGDVGVRAEKRKNQASSTELVMQKMCKVVELSPKVCARAMQIFTSTVEERKNAVGEGPVNNYIMPMIVACVFVAANENKNPRTINHLIANCSDSSLTPKKVHLSMAFIKTEQNKEMNAENLVDTVCHFHKELAHHANGAKYNVRTIKFEKSTTVQEMVAIAIVFDHGNKNASVIDETVLSVVETFLTVKRARIVRFLHKTTIKFHISGQGGGQGGGQRGGQGSGQGGAGK